MARDFIKIDRSAMNTTATQAQLLLSYVSLLRQAYDAGVKCKGIMTHTNDGVVFTDIETLFGLPAGTGQIVFNLVNGSIGSMQGTFQVADAQTITEKIG